MFKTNKYILQTVRNKYKCAYIIYIYLIHTVLFIIEDPMHYMVTDSSHQRLHIFFLINIYREMDQFSNSTIFFKTFNGNYQLH